MKKSAIYFEFFDFLRQKKKLWLIPLLVLFGVVAGLLVVAKSGGVIAPFIYTLF